MALRAPGPRRGRSLCVTGGTSGIGRALVRGLAEAGADVVPTSRRAEQVDDGGRPRWRPGAGARCGCSRDVTDRRSLEAALGRRAGRVRAAWTCWSTARAAPSAQPTLEVTEEDWLAIMETNLTGTLRACQVFGRHMLERGYGRIVNIASLASFVALYEVAAYSASKAAVASLTKSLAVEWGPRGVNVNAIAPGVFPTDLNRKLLEGTPRGHELLARTPLQALRPRGGAGGAAIFLSSDAASFVNGEVLAVDGGFLASGVNQ